MCRAKTNCDARHASDRLDDADDLRRPKRAPVNLEARSKVGDAYAGALVVDQLGHHDRGVANIVRANHGLPFEHDVGESLVIASRKQSAEHRHPSIARQTPPHDPRRGFEQCSGAAIPDDREIEPMVGHTPARPFVASESSALRTCAGSLKTPTSPGKYRETLKPFPPISGKTSNTDSSVTSSPMNTGMRALNGACPISLRMPSPLLIPGRLTSNIALPSSSSVGSAGNAVRAAAM